MQVFDEGRGTGWQHIYFTIEYETTRDGEKLGIKWKIKWEIDANYFFGYNLVANVWTEGNDYGRQIKANSPNRGSEEVLFPEDGGYYWFNKGYSSNQITGCRVQIRSTNGGTVNIDTGTDRTVTTPVGYQVSNINKSIDFIVGDNISVQINDITNQKYTYKATLKILNDNNSWTNIKSMTTTNKTFVFDLSDVTNTIYSNITTKNSTQIKIELETIINNASLGKTIKEGTCYITNSNPNPLEFIITNFLGEEIDSIITGYGAYNANSNIDVKINQLENDNGNNKAKLVKAIIQAGKDVQEIGITELIGTGTVSAVFLNAFFNMKDNEFIDGKAYVTVTIVDSRGNTAITQKQMTVGRYISAYFTELELKRANNIDEEVFLIAKGKCQTGKPTINYCQGYIYNYEEMESWGHQIEESYIEYDSETGEFSVNAPIEGDLGALGFTKDKEFVVTIYIEDKVNYYYGQYIYTYVRTGKVLMHYGKNGMAFGALYDETVGGSMQLDGQQVLTYDIVDEW